jgi:glucosamine-6-phosphate deaminase
MVAWLSWYQFEAEWCMLVQPTVFDGPEVLGRALAALIADQLAEAADAGRPFLLGCPSGRSPQSTYMALAREVVTRDVDLSGLVIVMMDEYVERDETTGAMRRVDPAAAHSCVRFGQAEIVDRLNAAAGPGRGISPDRYWIPDPAAPDDYDAMIASHGGIDLFIVASGASDGHVAFNPPGADRDSRTRVVQLAEQTRQDNLNTFPSFGRDLERVPRYGVTVGIATIREQSRQVVMVADGEPKAATVRLVAEADSYRPEWPATILTECARPLLWVDEAAASQLNDHRPTEVIHHPKETQWLA